MIEWNGVLGEHELLGWPWHGRVERDVAFKYWLVKPDGARLALADRMPEPLANQLNRLGVAARDGLPGTHLIRVPGHVMTARTPEQLLEDAGRGHEWRCAALLSGFNHALYGQSLGDKRFLYSNAQGVWLISVNVTSTPIIGRPESTAPLTLQLTAQRFGVVGGADEPVQSIGSVTAPSCLDVSFGSTWYPTTYYPFVVIQSIRSDGAEVVLEVQRASYLPSQIATSGAGYYKLSISRDAEGAWTCSLAELARASQMYSQSVTGAMVSKSNALAYVIRQRPTPEQPNTPYLVEAEVLADGGLPSGELYQPLTWRHYQVPTGTIEQQRTVHGGWVFDEHDVLHKIESRLRIVHTCSVPEIVPSVSGQWVISDGVNDNQISVVIEQQQSVSSQIVVEVLLDGQVVSAVSTVMSNTANVSYSRVGNGAQNYSWIESGSMNIAGEVIRFDRTDTTPPGSGIPGISNWPDFNGVDQWINYAGGQLVPWPGVVNTDVRAMAGLHPPNHNAILAGAVRLSNNVWAPAIICGRVAATSGLSATWWWETTAGSVLKGSALPPTLLGDPVGPSGAGLGGGAFSGGAWKPGPIEYDYLHGGLIAGGGVF